jgi:hypothetical protein
MGTLPARMGLGSVLGDQARKLVRGECRKYYLPKSITKKSRGGPWDGSSGVKSCMEVYHEIDFWHDVDECPVVANEEFLEIIPGITS